MFVRRLGRYAHTPLFLLALCCVVCLGPCFSVVHLLLLALVVPVSVGRLPLCFPCGFFSWCCGALLSSCCCSVFVVWLPSRFLPLCLGCFRFGPLTRGFPFPPLPPWLSSGVFWSSQCSAGPSLRVSGCICNGPVVIPLAWSVVADWLLSSLLFLATKASALCGALPSTPCCGCCSCAPRSCTEVFALG